MAGVCVAAGAVVFCLWPAEGDRVQLVTGLNRLVFTAVCVVVVAGFIHLPTFGPPLLRGSLAFLGKACYSIYLLHPLVAMPIVFVGPRLGLGLPACHILSAVLTFGCSWASYCFVEEPFMKLASRLTRSRGEASADSACHAAQQPPPVCRSAA